MNHAVALTEHAVGLWDGRNAAKGIARMLACSYRTVQDWQARRRAMCLDNAVELAAQNEEFRAALMARIEQVRIQNEVTRQSLASGFDRADAPVGLDRSTGRVAGKIGLGCGTTGAGSAHQVAGSAGEGA